MDRLSMSLDQIMAAKGKEMKEKAAAHKKVVITNNHAKIGNIKSNLNKTTSNQRSTPYLETNPSRSVVVPTIKKVVPNNTVNYAYDKPTAVKIIQPTQQYVAPIVNKSVTVARVPIVEQKTTTSSSVFARLGKQPISGTRVTFNNLQNSVTESDLRELSTAIGEVKDVEFSTTASSGGVRGKKIAVVLFARRSDALSCIEKYNGKSSSMLLRWHHNPSMCILYSILCVTIKLFMHHLI